MIRHHSSLIRIVTSAYLAASVFSASALWPFAAGAQNETEKRQEIERQIGTLESEAAKLDQHLQVTAEEKRTLGGEVERINQDIRARELAIRQIALEIQRAGLEAQRKGKGIAVLADKIDVSKKALSASLFAVYVYDKEDIFPALLKNQSLSDFFGSINNILRVQSNIKTTMDRFESDQTELRRERDELLEFQQEQQGLKSLQEVERRFLAQKKQEKDELLRLTKGKEALFQQFLQSKKRDIATLKTQLFYLEKTGITAENAIQAADLAAKRAGIRTAFLLALLEVETGKQFEDGVISVGTNLGTGNWKTDLYDCYQRLQKKKTAEAQKTAFFTITGKLGLNPNTMPVSRKPNYGCGGAMGPAQFLPTTWLHFEDRVAQLTGHNPPSPWTVEDAFTAAALFLADAGADLQTPAAETRAAKTYISGRPTCTSYICRTYASRILSLAKDIGRIL